MPSCSPAPPGRTGYGGGARYSLPPLALYIQHVYLMLRLPEGYEWDDDKASANLEKHGIAFEDAVVIFGSAVFEVCSITHGEVRIAATGVLAGELEITVVYTVRGTRYRIISARRARTSERQAYRAYRALFPW
jgi:uncharacterized protein